MNERAMPTTSSLYEACGISSINALRAACINKSGLLKNKILVAQRIG